MKRRIPIVLVLVALFALLNAAGGVYAGIMGEHRHAGAHVALALAAAYAVWVLVARRRANDGAPQLAGAGGTPGELSGRLTNLERSIDAIAVEVERVGEGQRFMTRLFTEKHDREKGDT